MSRRDALRAGVVSTALVGAVATGAEGAAAAAPETVVDSWISVADHGAVGDGVADDTAAIRAALAAARAATPGSGVYLPPATYRVTDEIVASGLTDFVLSGYGATLALTGAVAAGNGAKSILHLTRCQRFKVLGLAIRDTDRAQAYNGLRVSASSAGLLDGVTVHNVKWTGITVFDATPRTTDDIAIANCTVEGTRFGISTNGKDVRITGNHAAMDWPSTAEAAAKGGKWSEPSDYYDGIMVLAGSDRVVVANNTITECGQAGVYTQACTNLVIADNTVIGCQNRGIEIDGATGLAVGVTITGNTVSNCRAQINVVNAREVTIVGNRTENPNPGWDVTCIALNTGCSKVVIVGNQVRQAHETRQAVHIDQYAADVTVAWNTVTAKVPYKNWPDTVLMYASAPGQLSTNGKLVAAGGIGVGNSAPARSLGPLVKKIEVFSETGESLGFVPIYGSIT